MTKSELISKIEMQIQEDISSEALKKLHNIMYATLTNVTIMDMQLPVLKDDTTDHMIDYYLHCLKIVGKSQYTIEQYRYSLHRFFDWCHLPYTQVNKDVCRAFLFSLEQRGLKATSVNNHRLNISAFFSWLEAEDYIIKSPLRKLECIKVPKEIKPFLTDSDMERIRDSCVNTRQLLIVDMIQSTGARCSEMANLKLSNIDFLSNRILIQNGKGGKDRYVPLNARLRLTIEKLLEERKKKNIQSDYLFCSSKYPYNKLTASTLQTEARKMKEQASVNTFHIHAGRAYYATNLVIKGMDMPSVADILGHEDISTTKIYMTANASQHSIKDALKFLN